MRPRRARGEKWRDQIEIIGRKTFHGILNTEVRRAKGPTQASPRQASEPLGAVSPLRGHERRPGFCIQKGQRPERAAHPVPPLQGFVRDRYSQGVALGWHVAHLWCTRIPRAPKAAHRLQTPSPLNCTSDFSLSLESQLPILN
jgi:hypothetical protein